MKEIDEWRAGPGEWNQDPFAGMATAGLFRVGIRSAGDYADIARGEAALAMRTGLLGLAGAWAARQLVARFFIAGFGNETQRAHWLPRIANGACASVAISEPGVGAHPKHLTTRATPEADGVRLIGEKAWVTNGPIADLFVVLAITAEEAGRKRYSVYLVPPGTPGLHLKEMPAFHALHPAQHCGLLLDGCRVPYSAMLGTDGAAYDTMALPFRDLEDAVGLSGISAALGFVLARLRPAASAEAALSLGGLVGLAAVLMEGAGSLAAALDAGRLGARAAALTGLRLLAADLLNRTRAHCRRFGTNQDSGIDRVLTDIDAALAVARRPRAARQGRGWENNFLRHWKDCHRMASDAIDKPLRRVVRRVALLNLSYFGIDFAIASAIGSVSLFADSIDFLEDASVNLLILAALGWTARHRARVGMLLAGILLVPGLATLWTAWQKITAPVAPQPLVLSLAGLGALAVNLSCAVMLARHRHHAGSLTRAAFLSARNDAIANVAIIAAGVVTAATSSVWPDLIVGLSIGAMNADAASKVWGAARDEHRMAV